ncbi:CLUMA_CG012315, isoform A [Clunio marinus]|uniref:CLUMA_CG012315, isoform A n=1 Tax=Clunio marinus TaxID=568069 RepID=A0A1J1IFB3_9DIPT|nr:CLUMA_CG012315, isoform A [Clunio marinus]
MFLSKSMFNLKLKRLFHFKIRKDHVEKCDGESSVKIFQRRNGNRLNTKRNKTRKRQENHNPLSQLVK